ncbi:MAG: DUF748 domain-containing protein [Nitrospiraceae bacterium]|nr:DUF748 domain-containing protein [Nitrospiraceae bacterium]
MIKKIIIGIVIFVFLAIAGVVLFFPLDSVVKKAVNDAVGPAVTLKSVKFGWNGIVVAGIQVKTVHKTDFLKVEDLTVRPSLWDLLGGKLVINMIQINSPVVRLQRTKDGKFLMPDIKKKESAKEKEMVKKQDAGKALPVLVKKFELNNGQIIFIDDVKGVALNITELFVKAKSNESGETTADVSAKLPSNGAFKVNSKGNILTRKFNGNLSVNNLDIALFKKYVENTADINKGRVDFNSKFDINNTYLNKTPSVIKITDIDVKSKGSFMGVSAPLVLDLLKKKGSIDLQFNVWGEFNNLKHDLKEALTKKILEEGTKNLSPEKIEGTIKDIKGLFPKKK